MTLAEVAGIKQLPSRAYSVTVKARPTSGFCDHSLIIFWNST